MTALLIAAVALTGGAFILAFLLDGLRLALIRLHRRIRIDRDAAPLELMVQQREEFSDNLFAVTLADPDGKALPAHRPGQYLTLLVEREGLPPLSRCYSLAAWEMRPRRYELAIRRLPDGRVSGRLHRELQPGSRVRALPPGGGFTLRAGNRDVALIAGGIGITPLRAMLHALLYGGWRRGRSRRVVLFHAARYIDELCYFTEFRSAAKVHPNFRYLPILSRPAPGWDGLCGRLDENDIWHHLDAPLRTDFYLCASVPMMDFLREGLCQRGVAASGIHFEAFGTGTSNADGTAYRIALNGHEPFEFRGLPTLLHGMEQAGIAIDSDCRAGHCNACRLKLLSGRCRWLIPSENAFTEDEILACCTVPQSDLRLARLQ
jgi:ferredoxin-NADP reductase